MSEYQFTQRPATRTEEDRDQLQPWTIRCTWRVTDSQDEPFRTYHSADSKDNAMDRAVFVLDHFRNQAVDELVCVDVLHPDGWWVNVPPACARAAAERVDAWLVADPTG